MKEGGEVCGEQMVDGRVAKEIALCFPIEITVKEDVRECVSCATVWASGSVAGGWAEVIRVVGVKGMSSDELETCGLEGVGISKEDTLSKSQEDGGDLVGEGGVKAAYVRAIEGGVVHLPFREHAVFQGGGWGPRKGEMGGLFVKGGNPVRLVVPCPMIQEPLP